MPSNINCCDIPENISRSLGPPASYSMEPRLCSLYLYQLLLFSPLSLSSQLLSYLFLTSYSALSIRKYLEFSFSLWFIRLHINVSRYGFSLIYPVAHSLVTFNLKYFSLIWGSSVPLFPQIFSLFHIFFFFWHSYFSRCCHFYCFPTYLWLLIFTIFYLFILSCFI